MAGGGAISGTLTLLTAHPLTGAAEISGHFVPVEARGARTPLARFRAEHPALASAIEDEARALDAAAPQPLSIEWLVEDGVARLVQSAPQALAPAAHVRAIVERAEAGRIERELALLSVLPDQLEAAGVFALSASATTLVARGLAASPGAAVGPIALTATEVRVGCVWVVDDLAAEDAPLLTMAAGVVATAGGLTSDAAIMARALRKPCAVSTPIRTEDHAAGEIVSLDGTSGELHRGALDVRWAPSSPHAERLLSWAVERVGSDGRPSDILTRAHAESRRQGPASG